MIASIVHTLRLARAFWVLAREGVFAGMEPGNFPPAARAPIAFARLLGRKTGRAPGVGLAIAMGRLGPSYVKLGQFLASRPDVVGPRVVHDLEALQDRMPPFPRAVAEALIAEALGRPVNEVFSDFGEPVAAASIAQVHRARIRDAAGERDVAVKVLRPGVERRFRRDLDDMYFAARWAERHFAEARRLRFVEVVDTLARTVRMEMDFRLEAAAASEFAENVANDPDFRVPAVDWDRTARDVLTLEWIDGAPLTDTAALERAGVDFADLGRKVIQSFLRHAMRDGFFHADMHRGNLFLGSDGRLVAVDFGIMGRLGPKERRFLAEILYGFITRDYMRVAQVHFEAGYVPPIHRVEDFAQAIRAIGEPIRSRRADQISMARLLTLLFEVTALFDMRTRTELVLLQKTMVVIEGVARGFDPRLDMWATAEPVVRSWIEDKLGPLGKVKDAGQGVAQLMRYALGLPEALQRAEKFISAIEAASETGTPQPAASLVDMNAAQRQSAKWTNRALWLIVALLAIIGYRLA